MFRGEVLITSSEEKLLIKWYRKPIFRKITREEILIKDIIRWKYISGNRGPDKFIIIEQNGKRHSFRPALFPPTRDMKQELSKGFDEMMREFNKNTSREKLKEKIYSSSYLHQLKLKKKKLSILLYILGSAGLLILAIMFFTPEKNKDFLSILFIFLFLFILFSTFLRKSLKMEEKQLLTFN
ncbi:hypothetical protein RM553_16180 [Zunongwangia sp. F363]|uniref:Ycf36 n=1 Tax=Autumnicola tepida TaxID=3075595 RepID=A0ABU3CDF5_9FLAO|nr:hypothetical protein [Zunongwangia sp. F363]MDT0644377.1 hypothetical protein [Zunongwangia sp. F363]